MRAVTVGPHSGPEVPQVTDGEAARADRIPSSYAERIVVAAERSVPVPDGDGPGCR
jgi:hypothetical protein